jgi:hypothetical protein
MTPEKKHLLLDLSDEERAARQDATLLAGGHLLRRRRNLRLAMRSFAVVAILAAAAFATLRTRNPSVIVTVTSNPVLPNQPKSLTDEELLALFPNTPVALASLENGKKRLIFPKAGDEQRFVTRL